MGADLERTIIGRSSANKGEKTSPLAPLAGSRARGEGRWDGLGGGGRRCRLREKGAFCERDPACCDHPSPGPHPRKRGEGGSFGSSGWRRRMGADLERTIIGRSSANKGEKTSPLAPLAGSRARGEGRWDGLGGGGRWCRLREKGALLRTRSCVLRPPLTWASSPQAGRGRVFWKLGMEGADRVFSRPSRAHPLRHHWLFAHPGVPARQASLHPRLPSVAPPWLTRPITLRVMRPPSPAWTPLAVNFRPPQAAAKRCRSSGFFSRDARASGQRRPSRRCRRCPKRSASPRKAC